MVQVRNDEHQLSTALQNWMPLEYYPEKLFSMVLIGRLSPPFKSCM